MKTVKLIARKMVRILLALLGGALMPVLIWIALGVALYQRSQEKRAPRTRRTLGEILSFARLSDSKPGR